MNSIPIHERFWCSIIVAGDKLQLLICTILVNMTQEDQVMWFFGSYRDGGGGCQCPVNAVNSPPKLTKERKITKQIHKNETQKTENVRMDDQTDGRIGKRVT